jgi:hypothetical protein
MAARDMTIGEATAAAAGLLALILLQVAATDSTYVLHKYFWTDELCTLALLTDPSPVHAFRALQGSVDINPPGLHILLLGYTKLAGSTSEVTLRSFALLSMVAGLVGIYAILRNTYSVLVSIAAVLAVWSHPLVLDHAFEVRYYGPWLAAAVWFCFLLGRAGSKSPGPLGLVALGLTSFFLCTIHYFGIVTLLIIAALTAYWQRERAPSWEVLGAIAIGPIATTAAIVFLLPFQRAVTTVSTWIPDPTIAEVVDFGTTVLLPLHLGAVVILAWPARLTAKPGQTEDVAPPIRISPSLIGLTSLVLLVPILVLFSYAVQPVLISRYGLPAVAALSPAVAYVICRMSKGWVVLLIAFLLATSAFQLRQRAVRAQGDDHARQLLIEDIRERTGDSPVIFEAPHQLNVVWHYAADLRGRVFLLDFEKGELGSDVSSFRIWARDLAKQFVAFYDGPALVPWSKVKEERTVYLIPHAQAYSRELAADRRYPGFTLKPVRGQVHQLVRSDGQ